MWVGNFPKQFQECMQNKHTSKISRTKKPTAKVSAPSCTLLKRVVEVVDVPKNGEGGATRRQHAFR